MGHNASIVLHFEVDDYQLYDGETWEWESIWWQQVCRMEISKEICFEEKSIMKIVDGTTVNHQALLVTLTKKHGKRLTTSHEEWLVPLILY